MATIVNIFDIIDKDFGVSLASVKFLVENSTENEIHVFINSDGGDPLEAMAIHDYLKRRPEKVKVFVEGVCYSAATIILMAADIDDRYAMPNSHFLIHPVRASADFSTSEELRILSEMMDSLGERLVSLYEGSTDMDREEVEAAVQTEFYFDADGAVTLGIVGSILREVVFSNYKKNNNMADSKKNSLARLFAQMMNILAGDESQEEEAPTTEQTEGYETEAPTQDQANETTEDNDQTEGEDVATEEEEEGGDNSEQVEAILENLQALVTKIGSLETRLENLESTPFRKSGRKPTKNQGAKSSEEKRAEYRAALKAARR